MFEVTHVYRHLGYQFRDKHLCDMHPYNVFTSMLFFQTLTTDRFGDGFLQSGRLDIWGKENEKEQHSEMSLEPFIAYRAMPILPEVAYEPLLVFLGGNSCFLPGSIAYAGF